MGILLRVKRRRTDDPVEQLIVQSRQNHVKKSKIEDALGKLSVSASTTDDEAIMMGNELHAPHSQSFFFTRIDTVAFTKDEIQLKKRLVRTVKRHHEEQHQQIYTRARSLQQHNISLQRKAKRLACIEQSRKGLNLIDISIPIEVASVHDDIASSLHVNGVVLQAKAAKRVLNPVERQIDHAIWAAFQSNDFSAFFKIQQAPIAFQRQADGGSILMAAAMHNRTDVIESLLSLEAVYMHVTYKTDRTITL
jgi:hypothetical protein